MNQNGAGANDPGVSLLYFVKIFHGVCQYVIRDMPYLHIMKSSSGHQVKCLWEGS